MDSSRNRGEDSRTCAAEGITIQYELTRTIDDTIFFDSGGSPMRTIAHNVQQVTITAHGRTLRENDHVTVFLYPDSQQLVSVGNDLHVQGKRAS